MVGGGFDVYGKNVTIANKMESQSERGRINVSTATKEFLEKSEACEFEFEDGKIVSINEEEITTYLVKV